MKPRTIIVIENFIMRLSNLHAIAEAATQAGVTMIAIVPLANNKFAMRQRLRERNVYSARYARVIGDASLVAAAEHVGSH